MIFKGSHELSADVVINILKEWSNNRAIGCIRSSWEGLPYCGRVLFTQFIQWQFLSCMCYIASNSKIDEFGRMPYSCIKAGSLGRPV
jgi:hypothetical protein